MSKASRRAQADSQPGRPGASARASSRPTLRWALPTVLLAGAAVVILLLDPKKRAQLPGTPPPGAANATAPSKWVPAERLVGRWVRLDGGYLIEIRGVQPDGRIDAGYFNPNPIHVARAESRREGDTVHVFIELRDVNYPGATYRLRYRADPERLEGDYFQPAIGQTFSVEFQRANQ